MALSFGSVIYYSYIYNSLKHTYDMKVTFEPKEAEDHFESALCNALGYMGGYGLQLEFDDDEYDKAKKTLTEANPNSTICYEPILVQILREGGKLTFIDLECDGEYTKSIELKDVHENISSTPMRHLMDMVNENDDSTTADCIIQSVLYKEVIFG